MVFIAVAGGGIRAAYWTSAVMSCLLTGTTLAQYEDASSQQCMEGHEAPIPEDQHGAVFLASGISGGSLGLAVTRALGTEPGAYDATLSSDYLGPVVAGFAFRDAPNSILRLEAWPDRAAVLEEAWTESVPNGALGCGFLAAARHRVLREGQEQSLSRTGCDADGNPIDERGRPVHLGALRFPLLLLNGVAVDDACRLSVSALDLALPSEADEQDGVTDQSDPSCYSLPTSTPGDTDETATVDAPAPSTPALPGTRDAHDHLCADSPPPKDRDVSLATAAHLSARFPWVSPTGGLVSCTSPSRRTYDVDGGLLDSSGAGPIVDLWTHVASRVDAWNAEDGRPCIAPRLILIDNGYAPAGRDTLDGTSDRPVETFAPVGAVINAQSRNTPVARQAATIAFERALQTTTCDTARGTRVAHFYPLAHPGPQAPLGWTLSQFARRDLHEQIFDEERAGHNRHQAEIVESWFTDDRSATD